MSATALARKAQQRAAGTVASAGSGAEEDGHRSKPATGTASAATSNGTNASISHVMALEASIDVLRERLRRAKDERRDAVQIVQQLTLKLKEVCKIIE